MMKAFKQVLGVCVFLVAFASAVALAKFYGLLSEPVVMPQTVEVSESSIPSATVPEAREVADVSVAARFVTLDFERRRSYASLQIERDPRRPAPEKLYVWMCFFTPDEAESGKVWTAEPVELSRPFDAGDTLTLRVDAACKWCGDERAPRSGFYARIFVTNGVEGNARPRIAALSFDIRTATPVVVQAAQSKRL